MASCASERRFKTVFPVWYKDALMETARANDPETAEALRLCVDGSSASGSQPAPSFHLREFACRCVPLLPLHVTVLVFSYQSLGQARAHQEGH